jgi:hypothetical protein
VLSRFTLSVYFFLPKPIVSQTCFPVLNGHRMPKGPMPYVLTTWTSFRSVTSHYFTLRHVTLRHVTCVPHPCCPMGRKDVQLVRTRPDFRACPGARGTLFPWGHTKKIYSIPAWHTKNSGYFGHSNFYHLEKNFFRSFIDYQRSPKDLCLSEGSGSHYIAVLLCIFSTLRLRFGTVGHLKVGL